MYLQVSRGGGEFPQVPNGLGRVTTHQSPPYNNATEPSQFYSKLKKEIFVNNKSLGKENSFN